MSATALAKYGTNKTKSVRPEVWCMTVLVEDSDGVRAVAIDRPECCNAVDPPTALALLGAFNG